MSRAHHPTIRIALLIAITWLAAGCAAGSAWGMVLASLLSLAAINFARYGKSHSATDASTLPSADGGIDAGEGTWESCCVEGEIDTCYCPPMTACNYGLFTDCGEGTCAIGGDSCEPDGGVDAGPDAGPDGGAWEPCCVEGTIDTCYCPPGAICNYGAFVDCGGGMCSFGGDGCPDAGPPDGGVDAGPDGGGTWDVCCVDGVVDTCYCPPGVACNYGWFEACGDGLCVPPGETCPEPAP